MISFYPGPSQLAPGIDGWMKEAVDSGILTMNHRSTPFMELYMATCRVIREKLLVPKDYEIIFVSSATECWEIIAQSYPGLTHQHFFSGAFGEKWFSYGARLSHDHVANPFSPEEKPAARHIDRDAGILCFTQCETSNGTLIPVENSWNVLNPDSLIAVDATSALGGVKAPVSHADIWFASVQKCLGLPAGMGVMILSPRAIEKTITLNESSHYNSLSFILANARKSQTPYTPNVLAIYLLNRVLSDRAVVDTIDIALQERMKRLETLINAKASVSHLIANPETRSHTVCALAGAPDIVKEAKTRAAASGFILGNGYGSLKEQTFRIANFPAVTAAQWDSLLDFMDKNIN